MRLLTNITMTSFNIDATISLSYSQETLTAPSDILIEFTLGTFLPNGDIFYSF